MVVFFLADVLAVFILRLDAEFSFLVPLPAELRGLEPDAPLLLPDA